MAISYLVQMSQDEFGNAMDASAEPVGRMDAQLGQGVDRTAEPALRFDAIEIRADRAGLLSLARTLICLAHRAPGREETGDAHEHVITRPRNQKQKHVEVTVRLVPTSSLPPNPWPDGRE